MEAMTAIHRPSSSPLQLLLSQRLPCPPPSSVLRTTKCRKMPASPLAVRAMAKPDPSAPPRRHQTLLVASLALGFALTTLTHPALAIASHSPPQSDMWALSLGPEGPLVEEFWDNMRRYGLYFLTVATGGIYSLLAPVFALLRNPLTAILTVVVIFGTIYLLYLTLNTMLGVTAFEYRFA